MFQRCYSTSSSGLVVVLRRFVLGTFQLGYLRCILPLFSCVDRPPLSGLELGQRAVRELVDLVHVRQDRAIMRHHDGTLVL